MLFTIDLSALTGNLRGSDADTTTSTDTSTGSVGEVNKDTSIYTSIGNNGMSTSMPTYRPKSIVDNDIA